MYTRAERIGQLTVVTAGLIFAILVGGYLFGRGGGPVGTAATASPSATATATAKLPTVTFVQDTCCTQTARGVRVSWTASEKASSAQVTLAPDPGFPCQSSLDAAGTSGVMTCQGLLKGATDYTATLVIGTTRGTFPYTHKFKTMSDKLVNVKWFTEFEDAQGEPLACAAASIRIVQNYTTGKDPMTATQILQAGQAYNKSRDPGLDPAAIAIMQKRLDARNNYHYYRFTSKEDATKSAVYWLVRSGKPVHVISLAGQHDPVLVGFTGAFGTFYDDPVNTITQVHMMDPQRGDMRAETANRRPDMYRTPGFQSGQPIAMDEWNRGEWWFGFAYQAVIRMPDGSALNVERSDAAYPTPHWAGTFVIIVDDGDAEWPSDKEGRVKWR